MATDLITFLDYRPEPRYPPVVTPWTKIRVDYAPDDDGVPGAWVPGTPFTITPAETDPTNPAEQSFTVPSVGDGWYRPVFLDDESGQQITDPPLKYPLGVSPQYITVEQMKSTLTLSGTSFADDDINAAISSASRAIDYICQRRFYQDADAAQVRYYTPGRDGRVEIDDLVTLTSLATDTNIDGTWGTSWTVNTDYVLEPVNARADALDIQPYTSISRVATSGNVFAPYDRYVKVTGCFGWPSVPPTVINATTLLANRLLTVSRSAPLGIVPFEGGAIRIARSDSQVMMLIGPLIRHRVAVA